MTESSSFLEPFDGLPKTVSQNHQLLRTSQSYLTALLSSRDAHLSPNRYLIGVGAVLPYGGHPLRLQGEAPLRIPAKYSEFLVEGAGGAPSSKNGLPGGIFISPEPPVSLLEVFDPYSPTGPGQRPLNLTEILERQEPYPQLVAIQTWGPSAWAPEQVWAWLWTIGASARELWLAA